MKLPLWTRWIYIVLLTASVLSVFSCGANDSEETGSAEEYPTALLERGNMYANGSGVPKDEAAAVGWYRKAADAGDSDSMFKLGTMYENGRGVPKDSIEAYAWLLVAKARGNPSTEASIESIEQQLTPAARIDGQARAKELHKLLPKQE